MNLRLIGRFGNAQDAKRVQNLFENLAKQASRDDALGMAHGSPEHERFSEDMKQLLMTNNIYSLAPTEQEQFALEHHIELNGMTMTLSTDEADVSAFIKILIQSGARVEVYSANLVKDGAEDN